MANDGDENTTLNDIPDEVVDEVHEEAKPPTYNLEVINQDTKPAEYDFPTINNDLEIVAGIDNTFTLTIENKGDTDFPGGRIYDISLQSHNSVTTYTDEISVPSIQAGDSEEIEFSLVISHEGNCGMRATIEPTNRGKVVMDSTDTNKINEVFRSIPREDLQIVSLLGEIRDQIGE